MSQTLLAGLHDREAIEVAPPGSWIVDTVALEHGPMGANYELLGRDINWITRLNWNYGSAGTIPRPDRHGEMANNAGRYVAESRGCTRWIIGNETNHAQERPNGIPITPAEYARCFVLCRQAIKRAQPDAIVIPAPVAVWNVQTGDWLEYFEQCLTAIGRGGFDGLALHSYIHRADADLVHSDAMMGPPFQDRHFEFHAYRDTLHRVPTWARHLPAYMTEANPLDGWQAVGIIPAMLGDVTWWNDQPDTQKIHSVIFYRYPPYDEGARWAMSTKPAVMAEFAEHAPQYPAPATQPAGVDPEPQPEPDDETDIFLSAVGAGPVVAEPPREWDERLTQRGVTVEPATVQPGQPYWRVVRAQWLDESQAGGRHHILVDVLDENGQRVPGVRLGVVWPSGAAMIRTEAKPGEPWATSFNMSPSRNEYSIMIDGPSERVNGIGMGADTPDGFNPGIHTSTGLVFQRVRAVSPPVSQPAEPQASVPDLVHPVPHPAYRRITQPFGVNPERYARFGLDGHNGVDFVVPDGSEIVAVDDGIAIEVADDPSGYGRYVKLIHVWGESLYAHLITQLVTQNTTVQAGQVIGLSGNTGNSTGPHLHFSLRINPYTRGRPFDGYSDPMPYLPTGESPPPADDVPGILRAAAREFGLSEALVLSVAWAESSFGPNVTSSAGAMGIMQLMPATWEEWAGRIAWQPGVVPDILNPRHNARVGCAYLDWCIQQAGGVYRGLVAYNWGIGHVLAGGTPPREAVEYANKIIHGRDLLEKAGG